MRKSDIFTLGEILHGGQYEVRSALPLDPVIFDAGANIGLSAVWFSALYRRSTVHCFEPERENFGLLEANLGELPDFVLNNFALGAQDGLVALRVAEHGALHSVFEVDANIAGQQVRQITLGGYLQDKGVRRVDLLKLDVEGSELDVLRGLGDQIERVGVIIGELHSAAVDEQSFYEFLGQRGFRTVWKRNLHQEHDEDAVQLFEVRNESAPLLEQSTSVQVPRVEP